MLLCVHIFKDTPKKEPHLSLYVCEYCDCDVKTLPYRFKSEVFFIYRGTFMYMYMHTAHSVSVAIYVATDSFVASVTLRLPLQTV